MTITLRRPRKAPLVWTVVACLILFWLIWRVNSLARESLDLGARFDKGDAYPMGPAFAGDAIVLYGLSTTFSWLTLMAIAIGTVVSFLPVTSAVSETETPKKGEPWKRSDRLTAIGIVVGTVVAVVQVVLSYQALNR